MGTVIRTVLKNVQFGSVWVGKLDSKKEEFGESRKSTNENSQTVCL